MKDSRHKVLFVESSVEGTIGGSHFSLLYMIKGLDKSVFTPVVVMYENNEMVEQYKEEGAEVFVLKKPITIAPPSSITNRFISMFFSAANLLLLLFYLSVCRFTWLRRNRIDIVHMNNINFNRDWILGCRVARIPCVSHIRGIMIYVSPVTRFITQLVNRIVCISDAVHDSLIRCGYKPEKLKIVHNGIDPEGLLPDKDNAILRAELNLGDSKHVIGVVGNVKRWKGQDVVIRAMGEVINEYPDCKCLIVGDTAEKDRPYRKELETLIKELRLDKSVVFTGSIKNVANPMSLMDIVIHSSVEPEPFGRVIIEAMSLGKPVIASRAGGAAEIIQEPEFGLMHKPGDSEELSQKIKTLLGSPSERESLGAAGRRRVESQFHYKTNSHRMMELYHSCLNA